MERHPDYYAAIQALESLRTELSWMIYEMPNGSATLENMFSRWLDTCRVSIEQHQVKSEMLNPK